MIASTLIFLAVSLPSSQAQSLTQALSTYPELSRFSSLLSTNPTLAQGLISGSASDPKTILIPNDNAFSNYQAATGQEVIAAPADVLVPLLQYHVLNGSYTTQSFTASQGVTVPTLLTGEKYNNRSAGAALSSPGISGGARNGQVVFVSPQASGSAYVQSGLASKVNLTAVDGTWDGGRFQIIDGVLTLPEVCTKTIKNQGLTALSSSLDRTGLADILDTLSNVTCLAPTNQAFDAAGNPDAKLNVSDLSNALMFHTIPQPLYSDLLKTGQTFKSANNESIKVTVQGSDIFFNDAKVIQKNVLTNNGLIHVLDRIMSPMPADEPTTTGAASGQPSGTSSSTSNASATTTGFVQASGANAVLTRVSILSMLALLGLSSLAIIIA